MAIADLAGYQTLDSIAVEEPVYPIKQKSPGQYCSVIVDALNSRDFEFSSPQAHDLLEHHISPNWCGKLNCHPYLITFREQIEVWRQIILDFPDAHFELLGVDCEIHPKDRTADVVMRTAMTQGKERFLTACLLRWKFSQSRWVWYYHSGMRGIYDL